MGSEVRANTSILRLVVYSVESMTVAPLHNCLGQRRTDMLGSIMFDRMDALTFISGESNTLFLVTCGVSDGIRPAAATRRQPAADLSACLHDQGRDWREPRASDPVPAVVGMAMNGTGRFVIGWPLPTTSM